ncbi:alpha/beta hydrolase [uncultured Amnibacterium sp.]|uniref:alpha/beta hydrolase n=1 Tax=uncultured Amnibacterium sp. TaxID=1631851 RepID=UPI0035CB100C
MSASLIDRRSADWPEGDLGPDRPVALLLHGYGSNEHDLAGLVPAIGLALPWASLRAPLELAPGASAWFALTMPGDPDPAPVMEATEAIWAWIDASAGLEARVVPIGFSQGGLMASQLLRTRPRRVLAPVVLAGFVLGTEQPADADLLAERPAAFWGRGDADRVITPDAIARTAAFLPQHTTLVERIYRGLAHGVSAEEIDDVRAFLAAEVGAEAVTPR